MSTDTVTPEDVDFSRIPLLLAEGRPEARQELLRALERHESLDAGALRRVQLRHLTQWLAAVARGVPFYREHLAPALRRGAALTWDDFQRLPVLSRKDVQELGSALECRNPPPAFRAISQNSTSGSTGRPLLTKGSRAAGEWTGILHQRLLRWQGLDPDRTCAFITKPMPPGQADPPEGATAGPWAAPLGRGRAISLDLRADVRDQLRWLEHKRPAYLATYPSNLLALLKLSEELKVHLPSIEAVSLSSEPVSEELVRLCAAQWGPRGRGGARCVATYSASETGLLAAQAVGAPSYLVQPENAVVEVLRDDGSPCEPGEIGRVVVTTLQDLLRPLVRYEVGDYAELDALPPEHGVGALPPRAGFPRLRRIVGRQRTMVRLPDGRRIWPFFELAPLVAIGAVEQWQMVQKKDGTLAVRLVAHRALTADEERCVREVVEEALPGIRPRLEYVDHIPRTPRGKYLELVSEL